MGTRGFVGFVVDGQQKIAYNHWDSYPGGLGTDVLDWLRFAAQDVDNLRELVRGLRVVTRDEEPTDEDIERLGRYADLNVDGESERPTWYQLLRGTQGKPAAMLDAGAIEDASGFPADSLFAEYGYLIDLDEGRFEAYQGFQKSSHGKGRFASMEKLADSDYYPVALAASWPLAELPSNKDFILAVDPEDD